ITVIGGTTLQQHESVTVDVALGNYGGTTFNGVFDISLYYLDGSLAETIMTTSPVQLQSFYYNEYTFTSSSLNVTPGTYLMACLFLEEGGSWQLAGSTYYTNPIKVVVQGPQIFADSYENNDEMNSAYAFMLSFSGNTTTMHTPGANSHHGSDLDFYRVELPQGYDYTITARVHDSYNSGNGQTYTNDVLWSYHNGTEWSDAYDDVCTGPITLRNGGALHFLVAPYFEGETGTYDLDLQISRSPIGFYDYSKKRLHIYPNPASEWITIPSFQLPQQGKIEISTLTGKIVYSTNSDKSSDRIPVGQLEKGIYRIQVISGDETKMTKFIKQ
ncbi:MAG: T9SS type A sorting domain-containing protein, partial [Bacteroidales bacterium]|nr:T9SS type A sorting domain-containing protein [Bacteroidales bacterium]